MATTNLRWDYTKSVSQFRWDKQLRRLVLVEGSPPIPESDKYRARHPDRPLGLQPAAIAAALN
jgi:hypothetical protein